MTPAAESPTPASTRKTAQQLKREWNTREAEPKFRIQDNRVAVSLAEIRPPYGCTCVHTRKKHKQSGTCRKGCPCTAGSRSRPRANS